MPLASLARHTVGSLYALGLFVTPLRFTAPRSPLSAQFYYAGRRLPEGVCCSGVLSVHLPRAFVPMGLPGAVLIVDDDDVPAPAPSAAQPPAPSGAAAATEEEVVVLLSDDEDAATRGSAAAGVPSGHADSAAGGGNGAAPAAKRRRCSSSVVDGLGVNGGDGGGGGGSGGESGGGGGGGNEESGDKGSVGQEPTDAGASVDIDGGSGWNGGVVARAPEDDAEVVDLVDDGNDEEEEPPQQPPAPTAPAVPPPPVAAAAPARSPLFATPVATRRLLRELAALTAAGPAEGIRVTPIDDNLYIWRLAMTFADAAQPRKLDADFAAAAIDPIVTFEVRFPGDYPIVPPFVRVLSPIFLYPSTFVDSSGALCMEVLTTQGWAPAVGMTGLAVCVKATLLSVDARLDVARSRGGGSYGGGVREAMSAFRGMVASHGWRVPDAQAVVGDDSAMFPGRR